MFSFAEYDLDLKQTRYYIPHTIVFRLNKTQAFERMGENQNNCTHFGQFATVLEKGWIEVCQGKIFDEVFL